MYRHDDEQSYSPISGVVTFSLGENVLGMCDFRAVGPFSFLQDTFKANIPSIKYSKLFNIFIYYSKLLKNNTFSDIVI